MFEGFSDAAVDLFWNIRFHNDREWFRPHKDEFKQLVMQPVRALAEELQDRLNEGDPKLRLNLHISRVYRDSRRLFGAGPLNDHIWFSLQTGDEYSRSPCLWFEVGADGIRYGMGYWMQAADAARYRRLIDSDPMAFARLVRAFDRQDSFVLEGEEYARSKGHDGDPIGHWYNKRWIGAACERAHDAVSASHALAEVVEDGFRFLLPYFLFLEKVHHMAE